MLREFDHGYIGRKHDDAGFFKLRLLLLITLRVVGGATDAGSQQWLLARLFLASPDGRYHFTGHVGVRAVTEHDVKADNANRSVRKFLNQPFTAILM